MFRLDSPIMARERQEALYAYLLARGKKWTPMQTVVNCLNEYPGYGVNFHNSTARRWLTRDIEAINSSADYEKVIISGNNGIKLATQDEFDRFVAAETKEIFTKLKRLRRIMSKGSVDQFLDLEGKVHEAFMMEGS